MEGRTQLCPVTGGLTWVSDRLHSQCLCWHFLSSAGGGCVLTHSPHIEKGGETWGLMQASVMLGPAVWDKIFDFLALSFGAGQGCEAEPCPCRGGRAGPAWAVQVRAPFAVRFQARGRRAIYISIYSLKAFLATDAMKSNAPKQRDVSNFLIVSFGCVVTT